jgi:hypothetical protein
MKEALGQIDRRLQDGFRSLENKLQDNGTEKVVSPSPQVIQPKVESRAIRIPAAEIKPRSADFGRQTTNNYTTNLNWHTYNVQRGGSAKLRGNDRERATEADVPKMDPAQTRGGRPPLHVASVADSRAYSQYASRRASIPEADATRMARIVEANNRIQQGELPPNKQVQD